VEIDLEVKLAKTCYCERAMSGALLHQVFYHHVAAGYKHSTHHIGAKSRSVQEDVLPA
jgi:hypothetical protein